VDHEEVAGLDTKGDEIADEVGKAQRCAAAGSACFAVRRPWHGSLLVFANQPGWQLTREAGRTRAMVAFTRGSINDVCGNQAWPRISDVLADSPWAYTREN